MLLKNKIDKFKTFLKNDNVLAELEERYCYASDACNAKFDKKIPDLVVFVETIEDVQKVLKYANQHKIPVISRGAGTNMVGSCVCNSGGIILNFSKMNKILEINTFNMTATVQPGVVLGDLKAEVEKFNLCYPPDPSNYRVSTIGGSIAQSSGGATSFRYGTTKDYVLSLKVVTADGRLMTLGFNTSKNAVGYHLSQLIVGSEGTLAVVVEATLKLIPLPEAKAMVIAYFDDVDLAIKSTNMILSKGIYPASIDFMDNNSIQTVESFLPSGLKTIYKCLVLVDLDGSKEQVEKQKDSLSEILQSSGSLKVEILNNIQSEMVWRARRSSFAAATRLAPDVISDDIIVPRDKLALMIARCEELAEKYNLKVCIVGHIGDGNLHPQFVLNLDNEEEFRSYYSAKSEIYDYAYKLGGCISAEHGIGLEKMPYLENTLDKTAYEYMKFIKKTFDPKNILNPGKIFNIN